MKKPILYVSAATLAMTLAVPAATFAQESSSVAAPERCAAMVERMERKFETRREKIAERREKRDDHREKVARKLIDIRATAEARGRTVPPGIEARLNAKAEMRSERAKAVGAALEKRHAAIRAALDAFKKNCGSSDADRVEARADLRAALKAAHEAFKTEVKK